MAWSSSWAGLAGEGDGSGGVRGTAGRSALAGGRSGCGAGAGRGSGGGGAGGGDTVAAVPPDTCQPPLRGGGDGGTSEVVFDELDMPVPAAASPPTNDRGAAARLNCGISRSGGGGMG